MLSYEFQILERLEEIVDNMSLSLEYKREKVEEDDNE